MKNILKGLLVCLSLSSTGAFAALIDGTLDLGGAYTATGGPGLIDVTGITIGTAGASYADGDFLLDINMFSNGSGTGTASIDSFSPVVNFVTIEDWTLNLDSLNLDQHDDSVLNLNGTGTLIKAGFDDTGVTWSFSAQSTTSYSMQIATVVPVPAAVWLMGSGLLGLIGVARRKV